MANKITVSYRDKKTRCAAILFATIATFFFQSCGSPFQVTSLGTTDLGSSQGTGTPAQLRFLSAKSVLSKNCTSCHFSGGVARQADYTLADEKEFISRGYVVPGDISSSSLITRLKNYPDTTVSNRNMPLNASLSTVDYQALVDWVQNLSSGSQPPATSLATLAELQQTCSSIGDQGHLEPIRRLSDSEYENTIKDLFKSQYSLFNYGYPSVNDLINNRPKQTANDGLSTYIRFRKNDLYFDATLMGSYDEIAWTVRNRLLTMNQSERQQVIGPCYTDLAFDQICFDNFIANFGKRAYRRPLRVEETSDVQSLVVGVSGNVDKYAHAIYYFLISPQFLYHFEDDGVINTNHLQLSHYALASRLSYLLIESMPDQKLFDMAAANELGTDQGLMSAFNYLLATYPSKVKNNYWLFAKQWLGLKNTSFNDSPRIRAISNGLVPIDSNNNFKGRDLRIAMEQEVRDMFEYYFFQTNGSYTDLLTSNKSFTKDAVLASAYNVSVWDGVSAPPTHPNGTRMGLITKGSFQTFGDDRKNPFRTGGLVYKHILCRQFPVERPPDIEPPSTPPSQVLTTRQYFESLVPRNSACMQCHAEMEPMGMPFEDYDIFSRHRGGKENVFDSNGNFLAALTLDTTHNPKIGGQTTYVQNSTDLVQRLSDSGEPQACFAKQLYRYNFARAETNLDACTLANMTQTALSGSIIDILKAMVTDKNFKRKRIR